MVIRQRVGFRQIFAESEISFSFKNFRCHVKLRFVDLIDIQTKRVIPHLSREIPVAALGVGLVVKSPKPT